VPGGDVIGMRKLKGLLRLVRFELPFAAGVCVVMGQMFALGAPASVPETAFAFLSVFFVSASILVLNDCLDVETDRINAPDRPIPSGMVTPAEAIPFSVLLMLAGLLLSYFLGAPALACAIVLLTIGFLYNRKYKRSGLPGNLMVSFSVGMTFVYGGVSVDMPFNNLVWFFAAIAALVDLGEEIASDAMDIAGDRLIQSNSFAIRHGRDDALRFSGGIFFLVIGLTAVPFLLRWFTLIYLLPIAVMDLAIGYSTLRLLDSAGSTGRTHIRRLYLGATAGLLLFLIMMLAGI
jgi:geranylgeranylglycerol-phosphate geranylgeranyltransferase